MLPLRWGEFHWHSVGPRIPLKENQYKVILIDPVIKHFYFGEWSLPGWQYLPPHGTSAHWMVWWVWKLYESYAMAPAVTRSQTETSTYERFWSDVSDSSLHHHHQNTKLGNVFWKNAVHPSSRDSNTRRIYGKDHWSGGSQWNNAWDQTLYWFPIYLSSIYTVYSVYFYLVS